MVDLSTTYMGLPLTNPIVPSASPLTHDLDGIKRLEDAGAGAITLYSLFEEQVDREARMLDDTIEDTKYRYAESLDFFPPLETYRRDEEAYLNLIQKARAAVTVPIIASLNGYSPGGWTRYARLFEEAGASAIELNIYYIPTHPTITSQIVEEMYIETLREVKREVTIPVAVKLGPYFSALANFAQRLDAAGADGLVLFNRFYQPDLDIKALEAKRRLVLSTSEEMLLPLRWVAILHGQVNASLALTTGVHTWEDVVKAIMAGADVVNVCSVLLEEGVGKIKELLADVAIFMSGHDHPSVKRMRGILSHRNSPNPTAFERANYVKLIGGK